ncbi:MAG: ABC transporter substrate-binding protein [Gammaproteobacteria bacterium]|nr:ABC transporter substrate-binding protein [Gammaproteobacteria bacterium]
MKIHATWLGHLVATAAALCFSANVAAADLGATDEPIRLAMLEWTGQHVTTRIGGEILRKMGYKVEYVTTGNFPQFSSLADGSIHASLEIWMNNVGDIFPKVLAERKIEDIGNLGLRTKEGWIFPNYMKDVCPGLPDWNALKNPKCVQALLMPDTAPNGRLVDYPADWGSRSAAIIKNAQLPLKPIPAASEDALVAELRSAVAAKKPLLMMFWGPHWVLAEFDVNWVVMPPCDKIRNSLSNNAECIIPPQIDKVTWSGFEKKWPAAYKLLEKFKMDATEQQEMMWRIDRKHEKLDTVVKEWVEKNEMRWKRWIKAAQ